MVKARKYMGESSRKEYFIIGQLRPHIRVRPINASSWR